MFSRASPLSLIIRGGTLYGSLTEVAALPSAVDAKMGDAHTHVHTRCTRGRRETSLH